MKFRTDENRTAGGKAVESVKGDSRESHGADFLWKGEKRGDRCGLPGLGAAAGGGQRWGQQSGTDTTF